MIVANINHEAINFNIHDISGGNRYSTGSITAQSIHTYTWGA
jgi:hypothetical protein